MSNLPKHFKFISITAYLQLTHASRSKLPEKLKKQKTKQNKTKQNKKTKFTLDEAGNEQSNVQTVVLLINHSFY